MKKYLDTDSLKAIAIILILTALLVLIYHEAKGQTKVFEALKPFTIEWVPTGTATSYDVYKSIDDAAYVLVTSVTTTSYQDTGTDLQRLHYKIVPMNGTTQAGPASEPSIRCIGIENLILPTQPGQPKLVQE